MERALVSQDTVVREMTPIEEIKERNYSDSHITPRETQSQKQEQKESPVAFFDPLWPVSGTERGLQLEDSLIQEIDLKGLGQKNLDFLINFNNIPIASQLDTDGEYISTYYIFKTHVRRLVWLLIYLIYCKAQMAVQIVDQVQEIRLILGNLLTLNLLFNYDFLTGCIVNLIKLKLGYYTSYDSLRLLVDLLPTKDSLPKSLTLIVRLQTFAARNVSEVDIGSTALFNQNLPILQQVSQLIIWSCMIKLQHINIYESTGIFWCNSTNLYIMKELVIQSFKHHFTGDDMSHIRLPVIKLVESTSNTEVIINPIEILETNDETDWHDIEDDATINEAENMLIVYLLNGNSNHQPLESQGNQRLAPSTDLILIPYSKVINLQGYYTQNESKSPFFFHRDTPLTLPFFLSSLHTYKYYQHDFNFGQDLE